MKVWSKFRHSILFKFSGAFILVGLIPLFTLSGFSLYTITNHVEKYTVNNLQQMMKYMSLNLGDNDDLFIFDENNQVYYSNHQELYGKIVNPIDPNAGKLIISEESEESTLDLDFGMISSCPCSFCHQESQKQ